MIEKDIIPSKEYVKRYKNLLHPQFDPYWTMKITHNCSNAYTYNLTAKVFGISGMLAAAQVLVTHPLYLIKTRIQADFTKSSLEHTKIIVNSNGYKALWRGVAPTAMRVTIKEGVNAVFLIHSQKYIDNLLPYSIKANFPHTTNILSGLFIATVNTCVTNPIEAITTQIMTNANKTNFIQTIKKSKTNIFTCGFEANFYKNSLNWIAFLAADDYIKQYTTQTLRIDSNIFNPLISGFVSGGIITLITNPLDVIKTNQQKNENPLQKNVYQSLKHIIETQGVKKLFTGASHRFALAALATAGTSSVRSWAENVATQKQGDIGR